MRRPRRVLLPVRARVIAGVLALLTLCCGSIREDELECEEAASHLQQCCPSFRATNINCIANADCGDSVPVLSIRTASCIRDESCAQLVTNGVCSAAATISSTASTSTAEICP